MIRFTWLRFRAQALVALGALAVLAVVLLVTGIRLADAYDTAVAACKLHNDCAQALELFPSNGYLTASNLLHPLVIAVPCVLGMFWGAPLVAREFETGTYRLAWTQGSTRTRWLAVKLALVGAASMAVAGLLSLIVTWWSGPIAAAQAGARIDPGIFSESGIAPVGYAAFAFAFGVTAGLLIRRTLPAIAVTLAIGRDRVSPGNSRRDGRARTGSRGRSSRLRRSATAGPGRCPGRAGRRRPRGPG